MVDPEHHQAGVSRVKLSVTLAMNALLAGLNEALSWLMDRPTADEQGSSAQPIAAVVPPIQVSTP